MKLLDVYSECFLKENGFCKFDLGAKSVLNQLYNVFKTNFIDESGKGFFVTHNDGNADRAYLIHQEISKICEPIISKYWEDFEIFAAHFVVKKAKGEHGLQLHQDWNNVEESIENSVQIWIPLAMSYPENGGLGFFPKSHTFFNNYRSGSFQTTHVNLEPKLYPYLSYQRLFPGEAVFFYNNTFHCSFINSTEQDRLAVLINISPKTSSNIYCHKNGNKVDKYEIDTLNLYKNLHLLEKGNLPENLKLMESVPYSQMDNLSVNADLLINKLTNIRKAKGLPADYEEKIYPLLRDPELEKEINHRGYKVIDFLTEKERIGILELFPKYFPDRNKFKGRYSSMDNLPSNLTLEVHQEIQKIIRPRIEHFFKNAYSPISLLYSKKPDGFLDIDWHSDPSFILNEHLEPIYGIWCSLYDIGEKEGSLMVVPGSHRLLKRLNGTDYTWSSPINNYSRLLDNYGVQPNLKAGQAMLYDSRIIHSSSPNHSTINRDSLVMRVVSNHTKDFFNVLLEKQNDSKGYLYRHGQEYFYGEVVKKHIGKIDNEASEGIIYFFQYPLDKEAIENHFKQYEE